MTGFAWGKNYEVFAKMRMWNNLTWEWEAATKGTGAGQIVEVENFPATLSGSQVPILDDQADPTRKYKISNVDTGGDPKYFGYLDKDGNWYIMKLTGKKGLYAKGISGYSDNWDVNGLYIGTLIFDYFNNVF